MKRISIQFILIILFLTNLCSVFAQNEKDTIRILAIGNSFSEDAVEQYLYELGDAEGFNFVIGHMFIGGTTLENHWNNAENNSPSYSYRKIQNGKKVTWHGKALEYAIKDEAWDYICRHPKKFACAIPICGGVNLNRLKKVSDMPIRIYHGAEDPGVPVELSRTTYAKLKAFGSVKAEYIEFPGVGHECWNNAFAEPDFLSWMFEQKKK